MKNLLWIGPAVMFAACNGNNDGKDTGKPHTGDPCEEPGNICTWLGNAGFAGLSEEGLERTDKHQYLYLPVDIDFASDGTAYYPDYNNHRVRRVDAGTGVVTTISGTGMLGDGPNDLGSASNCWPAPNDGCDAVKSAWNHPTQTIVNPANEDEVWVAAWHNSRINKIVQSANKMYWYAGTGARFYVQPVQDVDTDSDGFVDGDLNKNGSILDEVQMDLPSSLAFADDGTLYFADQANHMIRRINTDGSIEDVAGTARHAGYAGDGAASEPGSMLHGHTDQKADPGSKIAISGNTLYVADTVNGVVRSIDLTTGQLDWVAGKYTSLGETTYTDAITGLPYTADGGSVPGYVDGPADTAEFNLPRDIAVGIDGELYLAEPKSNCIRMVDTDGNVSTFAGTCVVGGTGDFAGDEGPATDALFNDPFGVAVDPEGNVYVADTNNHVIRRIKH